MSDEINGMIQAQAELRERLSLISNIKILEKRVRELQEERDGYKNGQEQLQQMVSDLMDVNSKWAKRVERLEQAVDRHKANTTAPVQTIEAHKIDQELYKTRDEI